MRSDRSRACVAPFVLFALLLSACVSSPPVDDADPDGTLTTQGSEPTTIDPHRSSSLSTIAQSMMVFEPLLRFDPKTLRPIPAAAKDMPEISADGLTYRLTLRDDGRYSDGAPVRARDFAYGFARLCDPANRGQGASFGYLIVGCADWSRLDPAKDPPEKQRAAKEKLTREGVRATGERELILTLVQPASYFTSLLALWVGVPVRESDVVRGGELWTEPATYIGNGPFVLSVWNHNERMVFTPNRYYRSPPRITRWTKLMFGGQPAVALNAYRHDELDVLTIGGGSLGGSLVPQIETDAALRTQSVRITQAFTSAIIFNTRRPPFDDAVVRLAFAKALDREAYVRDALGSLASPTATWIPPGVPGHDPADTAQSFDPAEARRLLGTSRYAASAVLRTIVTQVGPAPNNRALLDCARAQWQQHLGIDVRIEKFDDPSAVQQLRRSVETIPSLTINGWLADYPDQRNLLSDPFQPVTGSFTHDSGFQNEEFDRLVQAADREPDRNRRDGLYQGAQRLLSREAAYAYLYNGLSLSLRKPWVRGLIDTPLDVELGMIQRWEGVYIAKRRK